MLAQVRKVSSSALVVDEGTAFDDKMGEISLKLISFSVGGYQLAFLLVK